MKVRGDDLSAGFAIEGILSCQGKVKDAAERVEVTAGIHRGLTEALGSDAVNVADQGGCGCFLLGPGAAEVDEAPVLGRADEVLRLQIVMPPMLLMQGGEGAQ